MGFGENIEQLINERGLKKCKVAERSGMRISKLSKIIHGKAEADTREIMSLCNTLNVSPNVLFGYDNEEE